MIEPAEGQTERAWRGRSIALIATILLAWAIGERLVSGMIELHINSSDLENAASVIGFWPVFVLLFGLLTAISVAAGVLFVRALTAWLAPGLRSRATRAPTASDFMSFGLLLLAAWLFPMIDLVIWMALPVSQLVHWLMGSLPAPLAWLSELIGEPDTFMSFIVTPFKVIGAFWIATCALADRTPLRSALRLSWQSWWLVLGVMIISQILSVGVMPYLASLVGSLPEAPGTGLSGLLSVAVSVSGNAVLLTLVMVVSVWPYLRAREMQAAKG